MTGFIEYLHLKNKIVLEQYGLRYKRVKREIRRSYQQSQWLIIMVKSSEYVALFGSIKNYSEKVKLGYEINCIRIRGF